MKGGSILEKSTFTFFNELRKILTEYRNFVIQHLQMEEDICQVDTVNTKIHNTHLDLYLVVPQRNNHKEVKFRTFITDSFV
jgi:hypothetical protein